MGAINTDGNCTLRSVHMTPQWTRLGDGYGGAIQMRMISFSLVTDGVSCVPRERNDCEIVAVCDAITLRAHDDREVDTSVSTTR